MAQASFKIFQVPAHVAELLETGNWHDKSQVANYALGAYAPGNKRGIFMRLAENVTPDNVKGTPLLRNGDAFFVTYDNGIGHMRAKIFGMQNVAVRGKPFNAPDLPAAQQIALARILQEIPKKEETMTEQLTFEGYRAIEFPFEAYVKYIDFFGDLDKKGQARRYLQGAKNMHPSDPLYFVVNSNGYNAIADKLGSSNVELTEKMEGLKGARNISEAVRLAGTLFRINVITRAQQRAVPSAPASPHPTHRPVRPPIGGTSSSARPVVRDYLQPQPGGNGSRK